MTITRLRFIRLKLVIDMEDAENGSNGIVDESINRDKIMNYKAESKVIINA